MTYQAGWKIPFLLALSVHAAALLLAMLSPAFLVRKATFPEIQTVELINFFESTPKTAPTMQQLPTKIKEDKQETPVARPPKHVPSSPPTRAQSPKKLGNKQLTAPVKGKEAISFNPVKQREAALKKIAERVEERIRNDQLLKAKLEQFNAINNQQIAEEKAREAVKNAVIKLKDLYRQSHNTTSIGSESSKASEQTTPSTTPDIQATKKLDDQQISYWSTVLMRIQNFWTLPDLQNWDKNLEAVYVIQVRRDGVITKKYFERKSESFYFNTFVEKAVKDADPLPAFPAGFKDKEMEIGLIFHPAGLL